MKTSITWQKEWVTIENEELKSFISYNFPEMNDEMDQLKYHDAIMSRARSGDYEVFVDIGAYIGYISVIASRHCKRVLAYEASPLIYGILLHNTKFIPNIEPHYAWVSRKDDIPRINRITNMERPFDMVNWKCTDCYNIPVITIDEIFQEIDPDVWVFVKIDIEGSEIQAMQGALESIKRPKTHWQIEVHYPEFYNKLGYFFPTKKKNFLNMFIDYGEKIKF